MIEGLFALVLAAGPAAPAQVREELKPFQFLVGSCWTGTFPDGKATDTHCFEPVYGGQFIRDTHVVKGGPKAYEGESIHAWDAQKKKLVYVYWANSGSISFGTSEPQASGEIVFPLADVASSAGTVAIKSTWTARGADSYEVSSSQLESGQWRELWRMVMKRDVKGR
jgi:hypothetical protein